MSVVNRWGIQVKVQMAKRVTEQDAEKARDLAIVRMRAQGQSWRTIGAFLGIHHGTALRRWRTIPAHVREHYGRIAVG